jgi:hypothetical protein
MEPETETDVALPATLRFTLTFGAVILVGWFALFFLLRSRW